MNSTTVAIEVFAIFFKQYFIEIRISINKRENRGIMMQGLLPIFHSYLTIPRQKLGGRGEESKGR